MKNFKWENGRQDSGYAKMLIATSKFPIPWDFYILKYPIGSEIKEHVDPVSDRNHYRLNIIIKKPEKGGIFFAEKSIINKSRIKFFRPDLYKHSLTRIEKGTRYVLSIGWAPRNKSFGS
jgi:hypothetical protein